MAVIKPTNFGKATLASPPSGTGGLSFTVAAGKGALFPSPGAGEYFYGVFTNAARSAYEIVKVEARSTDAFTISAGGRGQDGTTAATWTTSDIFYLPTTRAMWDEIGVFQAAAMALADVTPAADKVPYFTSATAAAIADLTAFARTLLDDVDAAAVRTTLGITAGSIYAPLAAGTKVVFQQTAAPTGWTKDTTHNDKALRVVTGAASSGGVTAFTSVFGSGKTTGSTVLTTAHLPASGLSVPSLSVSGTLTSLTLHAATFTGGATNNLNIAIADQSAGATGVTVAGSAVSGSTGTGTTGNMGTGGGHTHTESLDLQYVDVIVATKD